LLRNKFKKLSEIEKLVVVHETIGAVLIGSAMLLGAITAPVGIILVTYALIGITVILW